MTLLSFLVVIDIIAIEFVEYLDVKIIKTDVLWR